MSSSKRKNSMVEKRNRGFDTVIDKERRGRLQQRLNRSLVSFENVNLGDLLAFDQTPTTIIFS